MSDAARSGDETAVDAGATARSGQKPDKVYLVSYPKIMFLYPTVLTSLFCAVFMWMKGGIPERAMAENTAPISSTQDIGESGNADGAASDAAKAGDVANGQEAAGTTAVTEPPVVAEGPTFHYICARVFLLVLLLNLVVIAFDFPRTTSLTWFFAVVAVAIGIWTMFRLNEGLAPRVLHGLLTVQPAANSSFYFIFTAGMLFLFICVLVSRRFDYWEVRGNELLHHHGVLSDLERFSAPNLRIDKEINDVFEYLLLRSGRLILHPSNERRAIVLENVLFISNKEDRITRMLGALQVRVRTDHE